MVIATLFIATFWISNDIIIMYGYISRVASMIFLIFQGVCILSLAYKINEYLVDYHNEMGTTVSFSALLGVTLAIYAFDLGLLWYLFKWYGGCSGNIWLLLLLIAMFVIYTILTVLQTRENASILTNAIVLSYSLYLSWSAMSSETNEVCNPFVNSSGNNIANISLGFIFTIVSILSFTLITRTSEENGFSSYGDEENSLEELELGNKNDSEGSFIFPVSYNMIYFHIMMIFACCYYAMLLSNWNDLSATLDPIESEKNNYFRSDLYSKWMKLISQFACYIVFFWSLLGPIVLPDRDWDM
mmetsp:Transcript_13129/g.11607  ORF Transcript_13129/g.11607 Transcript_13129/m.11607 type:complete len:300 (+) Transcript_13129:390-1289(+)